MWGQETASMVTGWAGFTSARGGGTREKRGGTGKLKGRAEIEKGTKRILNFAHVHTAECTLHSFWLPSPHSQPPSLPERH